MTVIRLKAEYSSLWESHRGASPTIWIHTVFSTTRLRWTRPASIRARQASAQFTYLGRMEGWVDLGVGYVTRLFTCLQTVTHLSSNQWLLSPQIWNRNRAQLLPLPQLWAQVPLISDSFSHPFWAYFPRGRKFC